MDYVLSLALQVYEDGLCACGQPTILAHHKQNDGWYDAQKVQCHSCAARERATTGNGTDRYVPQPGEKVYTIYTRPGNKPLLTAGVKTS
ncbi:hypothetical protein AAHB34_16135 [Paenarthrobacter ureafaciens]